MAIPMRVVQLRKPGTNPGSQWIGCMPSNTSRTPTLRTVSGSILRVNPVKVCVQPDFLGRFDFGRDPARDHNFEMLKTSAVYQVSLDNIGGTAGTHRNSSEIPSGLPQTMILRLRSWTFRWRWDTDIYETGTGHFVSETNTGTKPGLGFGRGWPEAMAI